MSEQGMVCPFCGGHPWSERCEFLAGVLTDYASTLRRQVATMSTWVYENPESGERSIITELESD